MIQKATSSDEALPRANRQHGRGGSLFRKFFLSALLLLAFALGVLDFYLTRYTASRETSSVELRLIAEAHLVAYELANVPIAELNRTVGEAGARAQARVTVITHSGVVLADSQHDPETMENHANRPEVRQLSRAQSELLFAIATHWIAISAMWRFPSRTKGAKGSFSAWPYRL